MIQRVADRVRRLKSRRYARQSVLVGARGLARFAGLFQVLRVHEQRRKVPRLELERLLDRVHLLGAPPERLETAREIGPQRGMARIGGGGPHEQRMGLLGGAAVEHAYAKLVEDGRVVGSLLRN